MDVLRRPRPRRPAARDQQSADRSVAVQELTRLSTHLEQCPVSGGEEEAFEDLRSNSKFQEMCPSVASPPATRLGPQAAAAIRAAIKLAGGREVCFVCTLDAHGVVQTARVVARGG